MILPPPPGDIWQCLEALAAVTPGGGDTPLALHGKRPGMPPNPTRLRTENLWPKMSVGLRLRNCDLWVNWGETLPSVVIGAPPSSTFHPNNSLSPATLENPAPIGIGRVSQVCSRWLQLEPAPMAHQEETDKQYSHMVLAAFPLALFACVLSHCHRV